MKRGESDRSLAADDLEDLVVDLVRHCCFFGIACGTFWIACSASDLMRRYHTFLSSYVRTFCRAASGRYGSRPGACHGGRKGRSAGRRARSSRSDLDGALVELDGLVDPAQLLHVLALR